MDVPGRVFEPARMGNSVGVYSNRYWQRFGGGARLERRKKYEK